MDKKEFFKRRNEGTLQKHGKGRPSQIAMSDLEKETLEKLKTKTFRLVAQEMGVTVEAIYKRVYRLRVRIDEAQQLVNERNGWIQNARLKRILYHSKGLEDIDPNQNVTTDARSNNR